MADNPFSAFWGLVPRRWRWPAILFVFLIVIGGFFWADLPESTKEKLFSGSNNPSESSQRSVGQTGHGNVTITANGESTVNNNSGDTINVHLPPEPPREPPVPKQEPRKQKPVEKEPPPEQAIDFAKQIGRDRKLYLTNNHASRSIRVQWSYSNTLSMTPINGMKKSAVIQPQGETYVADNKPGISVAITGAQWAN